MTDGAFSAGEPLAYFLTWTTYGTWLPGDERGWRRRGAAEIQNPNPLYREMAIADLKEEVYELSSDERIIVAETIRQHCQIRKWELHALNVRSNHVHVVVTAPRYSPSTVRDQFKAWCTRKLKQIHSSRRRFWTEGASCRWINHNDDLEAAITYVVEAQDSRP